MIKKVNERDPNDSGIGNPKPTTRTAGGLSGGGLAAAMMAGMVGFSIIKYIKNNKVDSEKAREDAQQRMLDSIEDYIKKECYAVGNYMGVTPAPSPDKQGPYEFEVDSCKMDVNSMMGAKGTSYTKAMFNYQNELSRQVELNLKFKTTDATSYLSVPANPMVAPMSVNVNILLNSSGAQEDQGQGMERIANAVVLAIRSVGPLFLVPVVTATSAAGTGPLTWTLIK